MINIGDIVSITRPGTQYGRLGIIKHINDLNELGTFYIVFF